MHPSTAQSEASQPSKPPGVFSPFSPNVFRFILHSSNCAAHLILYLLFSLYRVAEASSCAFMISWQTSLLILRNNPQSGCSIGQLTFSPFTGHGNCFLAMTVAVLKEAACSLVEKGESRLQGSAGTFNPLASRI